VHVDFYYIVEISKLLAMKGSGSITIDLNFEGFTCCAGLMRRAQVQADTHATTDPDRA